MKNARMYAVGIATICLLASIAFRAGQLHERHPIVAEDRKLTLTEWSAKTGIPVRPNPESLPYVVINPGICTYQDERLLWELADHTVRVVMRRYEADNSGREVLQYYIYLAPIYLPSDK